MREWREVTLLLPRYDVCEYKSFQLGKRSVSHNSRDQSPARPRHAEWPRACTEHTHALLNHCLTLSWQCWYMLYSAIGFICWFIECLSATKKKKSVIQTTLNDTWRIGKNIRHWIYKVSELFSSDKELTINLWTYYFCIKSKKSQRTFCITWLSVNCKYHLATLKSHSLIFIFILYLI